MSRSTNNSLVTHKVNNQRQELPPNYLSILIKAKLKPQEHKIYLKNFSTNDLTDEYYWQNIGLLSLPTFFSKYKEIPDSILLSNKDSFWILLNEKLDKTSQDLLIKHSLGHIALGHIQLNDEIAHWDRLESLKNARRFWDIQVQDFLTNNAFLLVDKLQTIGLDKVIEKLATQQINDNLLSAVHLFKSYSDEIVEISQSLTEKAKLFPHQIRGIAETIARLRRFNVSMLADSVGLGKTRTTCAVIRTMREQNTLRKAAILTPRKLERNWRKELAVVGLEEGRDVVIINKDIFKRLPVQEAASQLRGIDVVVIEEAHQDLRNPGNRFHRNLRDANGFAKGILLTATPWNNRRGDVFAILSPFIRVSFNISDGVFDCFKKGFRTGRKEFEESDEIFQRVYGLTVLQRTRRQLREMGNAGVYYAPREPKLDIVPYLPAEQAAFHTLLSVVESIKLPYFNPVRYLTADTDIEWKISGTHRFFLLKRAESSMAAFRHTLQGMQQKAKALKDQLSQVNDSEDDIARWLASYYNISEDIIEDALDFAREGYLVEERVTKIRQRRVLRLIEEARKKKTLKPLKNKLIKDSEADIRLLDKVEAEFSSLFQSDPKLALVLKNVYKTIAKGQKILLVSQFADTAFTVYKALLSNPEIQALGIGLVMSTAKGGEDPIQINGLRASREEVFRLFAPNAWAQSEVEAGRKEKVKTTLASNISILVGTDTLSVGQNLQDARIIFHLDLTWNPMVLEQRIGRLDRPRHESDNAAIEIRYFLNLDIIEAELKLKKKIDERLQATYKDTAFDDEILPGYFELIETMRKLRNDHKNAQEIAQEIDLLLEQLATAKPKEVRLEGVESRREALNQLANVVKNYSKQLPDFILTLGQNTSDNSLEIAAELTFQAFDNNNQEINRPNHRLLVVRLSDSNIETFLDDLPQMVKAVLEPAYKSSINLEKLLPSFRIFDQQVQKISEEIRQEMNRLRDKRKQIRERVRPSWLQPLVQSVRSFLEKLSEKQYETFLIRYNVSDEQLGTWLDTLAAGVDLDNNEMVNRLRKLENSPALILDEFGYLRELIIESDPSRDLAEDLLPTQLSLELEPFVHHLQANIISLRVNLPK
ncbi:MAG: SNF2-related protein [Blastocatellia bacterium]